MRGSRSSCRASTPRAAGASSSCRGDRCPGKDGASGRLHRPEPPGLPGRVLQGAGGRGARPRLPVAIHAAPPAPGDRHLHRSDYEDIVTVRVKKLVSRAGLAPAGRPRPGGERMLLDEGISIVKVFPNVSKDEQRSASRSGSTIPRRLEARLEDLDVRKECDDYVAGTRTPSPRRRPMGAMACRPRRPESAAARSAVTQLLVDELSLKRAGRSGSPPTRSTHRWAMSSSNDGAARVHSSPRPLGTAEHRRAPRCRAGRRARSVQSATTRSFRVTRAAGRGGRSG